MNKKVHKINKTKRRLPLKELYLTSVFKNKETKLKMKIMKTN